MNPWEMDWSAGSKPWEMNWSDPQMKPGLAGTVPVDLGFKRWDVPVSPSVEAGLISAGRTFDKLAQGAKQGVSNLLGRPTADLHAEEKTKDAGFAPLEKDYPVSTFAGSTLPYFAVPMGAVGGTVGGALKGAGLTKAATIAATPLADAMMTGAGAGALNYTPEGQSTPMQAALGGGGGALGYGVGKLAGKLITPVETTATSAQQRIGKAAEERLGAQLTPGQKTGSATLQKLEASAESFPPTAGPYAALKANNQTAINRAAAKSIGETADEVTADVLQKAHGRITSTLDNVKAVPNIPLGQNEWNKLAAIETKFTPEIEASGGNKAFADLAIIKQAQNLIANGTATGAELRQMSTALRQAATAGFTSAGGNRPTAMALNATRGVIEDAIASGLPAQERAAYQAARKQYGNLMNLMHGQITNDASGNVSAKLLANQLGRKDKFGMRFGKNDSDMYLAARFGKAFSPIVGDSGTATRGYLSNLLGASGGMGALGALGGALTGQDPAHTGGAGALAPLALALAARGGNAAYMSAPLSAYLSNQLIAPQTQKFIGRAAAPLGYSAAGLLNQ